MHRLAALTAALISFDALGAAAIPEKLIPVASLYRNFAWEAFASDSDLFGGGLVDQSERMLSQFFDARLAKMIAADTACQRRTQAFCKLDFDILFHSQDPRIIDLRIDAGPANTVEVKFKDAVTDKETLIAYTVTPASQGWRISDVRYKSAGPKSLRTILGEPANPIKATSR
jgi:hypothetical protein